MNERYTDAEIKLIRAQLRLGTKMAKAAIKKRGVKLHPRIAAARALKRTGPQKLNDNS